MSLPKCCVIFVVITSLLNRNIESAENESRSVYHVISSNSNTSDLSKKFYSVSCNEDEIYDEDINSCRIKCLSPLTFNPVTKSCLDEETSNRVNRSTKCKHVTLKQNTYQVFEDGFLKVNRSKVLFSPDEYNRTDGKISLCFPFTTHFLTCEKWILFNYEFEPRDDGLTLWNNVDKSLLEYGEFYFDDGDAAICISAGNLGDRPDNEERAKITNVYSVAWTISAISLALAIFIYFIIHKNMKCQTIISICHMAALFTLYIILLIRAWSPPLPEDACIFFGFALHYCFLAAFFWLNVLAYDIWKYLPRCSSFKLNTEKTEKRRFIFMSLYAWGCPLVIAVITLLVDFFTPMWSHFKPKFLTNCWFVTIEAKLLFMYGFAGLILICNTVFFIITIINLRKLGNDAAMVNKNIHKQLVQMYLKLMIVMGLTWVMEVVSGLVIFTRFWYAIDFLTGLQGFFLFIVYVCKPSVLRNLMTFWQKKMGICSGLCKNFRQSNRPSTDNASEVQERSSSLSGISTSEFGSNLTILPPSEYTVDVGSVNTAVSSNLKN